MSATVPQMDPAAFAANEAQDAAKERIRAIYAILVQEQPESRFELDFETPFQMLIAISLAARAKDSVVNERTPQIFSQWPTPAELAQADPEDIKPLIKGLMNYNKKAENLVKMSQALVADHNGEVPADVQALVKLPGVGRKTAISVLGGAMGIPAGIAVDTHVNRTSTRLGFAITDDTDETERVLCDLLPQDDWIGATQRFTLLGRYICKSKEPDCAACPVKAHCPSRSTD